MKRKSLITIFAIAFALSLALSVFTGCKKNKHKFSDEWKYNETSHWHECLTKKHTDTTEKIAHDFNAGEVIVQPSEENEGVKRFTCNTCGYQKNETVAKLAHTHTFNNGVWENDEVSHWHPATCAHKGEKSSVEEHIWDEGVVTTEPTETTEGVKTYTCTKCGRTKTAPIGKLDHVHTFDTTRWDSDAENHWRPATCSHTDEKESIEKHIWNEGVVTTEPTETTEGVKTYTCTKCGRTKTASIGQLDHVHTFDTTRWEYDTANHWHPATCPHTDEKKDLAAHNWNEGVITKPSDYGVEGEKTFTCATCSATRVESVPATPPKYNTLTFDGGLELSKTYDGTPVVLNPENVYFNGNGELTIEYKLEDESDSTYTTTAPTDAGEYTVRASVAGTAEWYGISNTKSFTIMHRILTLSESVYSKKIDQTLESGKFGLECKNVQEETNNTLTWVTVEVPEQYRAVGIHNMRVGELIVDNPNYMFNIADETNMVRLTVWDAPEFYAGVQDVLSITGRGTVLSVQIANGTVNIGDQLYINELGKVFTVTAMEKSGQAVETANAGDTVGLLTKDVKKEEVLRGYTITKLDTVASYDKVTATIRVSEDKKTPLPNNYKPNARFVFIEGIGDIPSTITFPTSYSMLMPGTTLEGVTVDFQGATVPAFVGRRFLLIEGGKTVAEGVVTDVAHTTRVNCAVSEPTDKTAVIEPIENGKKTFALNLNRSSAIENLVDSEAIDLVVKYNGVTVGSYKRTGLGVGNGDLAHVENGGKLQGSYINIDLAKDVAGLTDADGNWICEQENVTFDVSATLTQQLDNLGEGSVETVSLGKDEVKYFTLNELEPLTSGWYGFVNAFNNNGSSRYEVYTDAGVKVDMMSDTFKSTGGKYYVRYTVNANILNAQIGFIAAKGELEATNITTGLQLPAGKKDDRVVIKVTVKRAITYFHTNYVRFTQKVGAFNGRTVNVFYADYSKFDGIEYTTLTGGDRFKIPNRNNQEIYVYILMEYAADVAANTAGLKFINSTSADSLPVVTTSGGELKSVDFKAKEFKNFYFKVSTPGKYRVEIVQSDSTLIVPFSTIGVDKLYDFNFNPVNVIGSTDFNVTETGNYSITLKNHTDSEQSVRIHVVKVS